MLVHLHVYLGSVFVWAAWNRRSRSPYSIPILWAHAVYTLHK